MRCAPLLFFLFAANCLAYTIPESFERKTDSVFLFGNPVRQETFVHVFKDPTTIYYAATFRTMPFPLQAIRAKLENVPEYGRAATFVRKGRRIPNDSCRLGTYLIVVSVAFAKSWFLCDIDSIVNDGNDYRMFINQNHNEKLNAQFRKEEDGILAVEYEQFNIYWRLRDLGNGTTRAAMVACVDPRIWIPDWLF